MQMQMLRFCSRSFQYRLPSLIHQQQRLFQSTTNALSSRFPSASNRRQFNSREKNMSTVLYVSSIFISLIGVTYAAVPLYRLFCQATGFGGTVTRADNAKNPEKMIADKKSGRKIRVSFNSDTSLNLKWEFQPQQSHVYVYPGETALVFYTAKNPTDKDIIGISTYNVVPMKTGSYFNKIQCFCFEEQKLKAGEQVDMPVFFFIDPDFNKDPQMEDVKEITLSYTFFRAANQSVAYNGQPENEITPQLAT